MKISNHEMNPGYESSPKDAIDMLIADHKRVANLFANFKRLADEGRDEEKAAVVEQICLELTFHTQLEEELFYPAVRQIIDDEDQMDEALVEHAGAKQLITQLQAAAPDDDLYDAKVTVLGEQIDHHVEEEEGSMFPKARHAGLDTLELGTVMLARKKQLQRGSSAEPAKARSAGARARDVAAAEDETDRQLAKGRERRKKARGKHATKKAVKAKSSVASRKQR